MGWEKGGSLLRLVRRAIATRLIAAYATDSRNSSAALPGRVEPNVAGPIKAVGA